MFIIGSHPLSFLTRLVHVASMSYLLGGSLLLWGWSSQFMEKEMNDRLFPLLSVARVYERFSWLAIGLILLTGVGNLGVFGSGLPDRDTLWGIKLTVKLSIVLIILLLSLLRTMLVVGLRQSSSISESMAASKLLQWLYIGSALTLVAILLLAVSLAHA